MKKCLTEEHITLKIREIMEEKVDRTESHTPDYGLGARVVFLDKLTEGVFYFMKEFVP